MKSVSLRLAARTDVGMVRDHNEDNFIVAKDVLNKEWIFDDGNFQPGDLGSLLMVADGMGGTNAGEVASEIAVESIREFFSALPQSIASDENQLRLKLAEAIVFAHDRIVQHAKAKPETEGMGTTAIIAWIIGMKVFVGWSGDSRGYLFRPTAGLVQMSTDHSYVQELVDQGKITEEQAFYHPQSNIITQSLGDPNHRPKPDVRTYDLAKGDRVLLCSDGLCGLIQDPQIEEILRNDPDMNQCLMTLIDEANKAGGHDNITAVMADILEGEEAPVVAPGPVPTFTLQEKRKKGKAMWIIVAVILLVMAWFGYKNFFKTDNAPGKNDPAKTTQQDSLANDNKDKVPAAKVEKKDNSPVNDQVEERPGPEEANVVAETPKDKLNPDQNRELGNIIRNINFHYAKLAIANDSITNVNKVEFKKHLNVLASPANLKIPQVCSEIQAVNSFKTKIQYAPNKSFDDAVVKLDVFGKKICR